MCHRERSEVKNAALLYDIYIDFIFAQHHIRTGSAVKRKVSVAVFVRLNKSERCADILVKHEPADIRAAALDNIFELLAEDIVSNLADKRSAPAELVEHCQNIARRAAGICLKNGRTDIRHPRLRHIDEQFAYCGDIKHFMLPSFVFCVSLRRF